MNDDNALEEMIKEIAAKHGIALGRDDPILILQTLNNRLLQDNQKAQQAILNQYKEELEALSLRWSSDTKEKAERILNASLESSKVAMDQLMQAGTKELLLRLTSSIDESLSFISYLIKDTKRIGAMNIIASCITVLAVAALLVSTSYH
jgi:uncharacterized membrane protein YdbT with pleckstrin-like domain